MDELKHPVFYNSPVGIRFEIGGDESVYLDNKHTKKLIANPAYICAALDRAKAIYASIPHNPNILRIDGYPSKNRVKKLTKTICRLCNLPIPHEQVLKPFKWSEGDEPVLQLQLYWDLERIPFAPDKLLQETIKADIGGYNDLASSVYYTDTYNLILYHLYDDRGADLVAADKELLRPIYKKFNSWILDYDRENIDSIFAK